MADLFSTLRVGPYVAKNRVFMAPLTRCRGDADLAPTDLVTTYYEQRASAGLIVSEASPISQQGVGYPNTPGLFTDKQVAGWKRVTAAVHAKGAPGTIVLVYVFLAVFVLYYFANWKVLSMIWKMG